MRSRQPSYAAGVLDPALHSRTDLAKWQVGLAEANNMIVQVHGGVKNRPGLSYIGDALGPNRLLEFEYAIDDTYALEFTDYKMRVIRNGAFVVEPATTDTAVALTLSGLSDGFYTDLDFDRATDIVYTIDIRNFVLPDHVTQFTSLGIGFNASGNPVVRSRDSGGTWYEDAFTSFTLAAGGDYVIEVSVASGSTDVILDVDASGSPETIDLTAGATRTSPELPFEYDPVAYVPDAAVYTSTGHPMTVASVTLEQDTTEVYTLAPHLDGYFIYGLQDYYNRGELTNKYPLPVTTTSVVNPNAGDIMEVVSPFAFADLYEVRYVQREDVMFMVHPSYGEYALTRYDHDDWAFTEVEYEPNISSPDNLVEGASVATGSYPIEYQVAAISLDGEESLPSDILTVTTGWPSTNWKAGDYITLTWDAVAGADLYVVYKNSRGYFGYIGSTTDTEFRDDNIASDSADGPKVARTPFDGANNKPSTVGIYQQRKVYGRTNNLRQTIWLTQTGTMDSLAVSRPLKDTDAITAPLDSNQVNQIQHLIPMKQLVVITNNGVWTLSSGDNTDILTPTSARYDLQSADGGSRIKPLVSGNTILVVPSYRDGVKELFYQIQAGGFEGTELNIMADHLFEEDKIVDWALQRDESIVWCVMASGILCSLTYLRPHDVVAWTTHDTLGTFESVVVVKEGDRDVPHFGVKRTINGTDVRFIESLNEHLPNGALEDGCFLDASISYDGAATDTFTGASHLANTSCTVLADGNVIENVVVGAAGGFTLSNPYSKVHIGLPYTSDFETLDVDYQDQGGDAFGSRKNIPEVTLAFKNTRGVSVGPNSSKLVEMKFRTDEGYDEPTRLFTGKKKVQIHPDWNSNGKIHVRQAFPLPMTILSHVSEVLTGDE